MDIVEISNLHRQTLFDEEDAHTLISKVEAIKHKVNQINTNVNLTTYDLEVTSSNIENLIKMSNQTSSLMAWITSKYDTRLMRFVTSIKSHGFMVQLLVVKDQYME